MIHIKKTERNVLFKLLLKEEIPAVCNNTEREYQILQIRWHNNVHFFKITSESKITPERLGVLYYNALNKIQNNLIAYYRNLLKEIQPFGYKKKSLFLNIQATMFKVFFAKCKEELINRNIKHIR